MSDETKFHLNPGTIKSVQITQEDAEQLYGVSDGPTPAEAMERARHAHAIIDQTVDRTQELLEQSLDPEEALLLEGGFRRDEMQIVSALNHPGSKVTEEPINSDFEKLALEDEELEPLMPAQELDLTMAIHRDHTALQQRSIAGGELTSLAHDVPIDLPTSPSQMFEHDVNYLNDPMPVYNPDGTLATRRHEMINEPLGSPEDHAAISEYIQGKRSKLTEFQQELLTNQLLRTGALGERFKGMSASDALNTFFRDLRRMQAMQKRNPVTFGFRVPLKSRVSKTRDKKKKAKRK
jgi:hypothetical protein